MSFKWTKNKAKMELIFDNLQIQSLEQLQKELFLTLGTPSLISVLNGSPDLEC